jgi:adenosylhomocysteine nucleosidase
MRIALTFAVPSEFALLRRRCGFSRIDESGAPAYKAHHGGDEIYALVTGVGARGVGSELRRLFAKPVDLCIASGLTGALKKEHRAGTLLVARTIVAEANATRMQSDPGLVDAAVVCGAGLVDCFYTSGSVVNSRSEKQRLSEIADAVDMESFQVMNEARRARVPAVALRAVSDSVDNDLPIDFNRVLDSRGQLIWSAMLRELLTSPSQLVPFVRFSRDSVGAARNLSRFLERYVNALSSVRNCCQSPPPEEGWLRIKKMLRSNL